MPKIEEIAKVGFFKGRIKRNRINFFKWLLNWTTKR